MSSFNPHIQQWPPWNEDRVKHLRDNVFKIRRRRPEDATLALRQRIAHLLHSSLQLAGIDQDDFCLALDIPRRCLDDILHAKPYPIESVCYLLAALGLELDCRTVPDDSPPIDIHRWTERMRVRRDNYLAHQLELSQAQAARRRARKWCQRAPLPDRPWTPPPDPFLDSPDPPEESP